MAFSNDFELFESLSSEWLDHTFSDYSPSGSSEDWLGQPFTNDMDNLFPTLDSTLSLPTPQDTQEENQCPESSETPATSAPTPSSFSSGPSASSSVSQIRSYRCTHSQCPCGGRSFARQSDLKKHVDRLMRPFCCERCTSRTFATRHDLGRHMREVHKEGLEALGCPLTTCKRHKKGFGRRENLVSHVKRVHGESCLRMLESGVKERERGGVENVQGKLEALMREREEVAGRLGKVDEEIAALKMTIEVMSR